MLDRLDITQLGRRANEQRRRIRQRIVFLFGLSIFAIFFMYLSGGLIYSLDEFADKGQISLLLSGIFLLIFCAYLLLITSLSNERARINRIIHQAIPDLADLNLTPPNGDWTYLTLITTLFAGALLIWRLDPANTPLPAYTLTAVLSPLWTLLLVSVKRMRDRAKYPDRPFIRPFTTELSRHLLYMINVSVFIPALVNTILPADTKSDSFTTTTAIYALFIIAQVIRAIILRTVRQRAKRITTLLRDASYAEALAEVAILRRTQPYSVAWLGVEGLILLYSGQLEKAEVALRNALAVPYPEFTFVQIGNLTNLAYTVSRQARYSEAIPLYQATIDTNPASYAALIGLAEVYVEQGININRSIMFLREARAIKQKNMKRDRNNWGAILIDQAWLLAITNQPVKADEVIAQAFRETDQKHKPKLAIMNYRAGHIMTLRGDSTAAAQYFKKSLEFDPVGTFAGRASDALAKLNAIPQ